MGGCCSKKKAPDDPVSIPPPARPSTLEDLPQVCTPIKAVDSRLIDRLVIEMLTVAASRVDTDEQCPVSLVKLHVIADNEEGWIQVMNSMVTVIPLENPFGPTAISILLDECPLPSKETVIKVTQYFGLSAQRACGKFNTRIERNICVALGCIAEKLVGPNSVAILTHDTLDYLLSYLYPHNEPCIVLFALIAIQKFALTTENKLTIKARLEELDVNPLVELETFSNSDDCMWRQVGFCAKWALDNTFLIEGRLCSYETVDMSGINAILNSEDVSDYLQIACNGLEARCDSYSFESVRCTFQVDRGCWYYEAEVITPGVMQIGWATKNSHFLNDGYGIGDDVYSLAYDGCRRLIWYNARPTAVSNIAVWRPGDVLGCLIDLNTREAIFSLNGQRMEPVTEIFDTAWHGFFAAASFMAYQQCRFNFGYEPFRFPPTDRAFSVFNEHGLLREEQKQVLPKRLQLQKLKSSTVDEDTCIICYNAPASCVYEPCGHQGFCSLCTSELSKCPICRGQIANVMPETA